MKQAVLVVSALCVMAGADVADAGAGHSKPCVTSVYASPSAVTAGQKTMINATTNKSAARVVLKFADTPAQDIPMTGKDHTWSIMLPPQTRAGSRPFTVTAFDSVGMAGEAKAGTLQVKPAPPATKHCPPQLLKPSAPANAPSATDQVEIGPPEPAPTPVPATIRHEP